MEMVVEQKARKSWEEYITLGMEAREQKDNVAWTLGDLSLSVSKDYGEDAIGKYAYGIGVERKTLMNYRTISGKFSPDLRQMYRKLSYSHFSTVASVERPEAWLEQADNNDWSVETLRKQIRTAYGILPEPKLEETPKAYRCPECHLWRLEDISALNICKGHYKMVNGVTKYE